MITDNKSVMPPFRQSVSALGNGRLTQAEDQVIVRARMWTEALLRELQKDPGIANTAGMEIPEEGHPGLLLSQGGGLSIASTQPKKADDAKAIFSKLNPKLEIVDPIQILHWFLSADEVSKSFVGNAYEKAETILNRVYDLIGYDQVAARLKERGFSPDKFVFCVNDCGLFMNTDYSAEPEFARSLHEKGHGPWPGVEFGPVVDAQGGLPRFFADFGKMAQRKEGAGETVDYTGRDHQTYIMFKLRPKRADVTLFSFEASVPLKMVLKPAPLNGDILTSFHYTQPVGDSIPEAWREKTRAQIGRKYMTRGSAEAYALRDFLEKSGVPLSFGPAFKEKAKKTSSVWPVIHTQHNILPGAPDLRAFGIKKLKPKNKKPVLKAKGEGLKLKVNARNHYDTTQNGAFQRLTLESDAIVLGAHSPEVLANWDDTFLERFDLWSSLIVDKQVRVETFEGKPFIVLNRQKHFSYKGEFNGQLNWDDPKVEESFIDFLKNVNPEKDPWLQFILLTRYLHEKAFVKQEPRFLFRQGPPDTKALAKALKEEQKKYRGQKIEVPDYGAEHYGEDRTDLFEITFLGSAGSRVAHYTQEAYTLAGWCAEQGWHVRTGGGRYGIMGAAARGVIDRVKAVPELAEYCYLSAIQMPRTLQFEGACFDPVEVKQQAENGEMDWRYMLVTPSFDTRMRSLFRSNALVALAPGMGTYQEIVRFCRWKEAGHPELQGKKVVLVNSEQPGGPGRIRLMDPFLALVPKRVKEEHMIIVPDAVSAKAKIQKVAEQSLGMKMGASVLRFAPEP